MLSLKQCRELLPADSPESDADLEKLRDQLYGLVRVAVEVLPEKPCKNNSPRSPVCFDEALRLWPEDERYELLERAAIEEFDGGLDQSAAECAAFSQFWREKHRGKPG